MSAIIASSKPVSTGVKSVDNEMLTEAIEILESGKSVMLPHTPLASSGAYSDPYVCAYYPLHYLRLAIVKSGAYSSKDLKIQTSKSNGEFTAKLYLR